MAIIQNLNDFTLSDAVVYATGEAERREEKNHDDNGLKRR